MRTTLTLDDDVARQLQRRAGNKKGGFKRVVNETLRRGLTVADKPAPASESFIVEAGSHGFLSGVDHLKLNQILDELEAERFVEQHLSRGSRKS